MEGLRKNIYIALLVGIGLGLSLVESMMPNPLMPGAKLGLSNIVTLTAIVVYGFRDGMVITILKSLLLVLVTGNVIALFYSLPSGMMSCIVMNLVYKYFSERKHIFSLIGVSILGAVTHNFTQVTIASIILKNIRMYMYLPLLLVISIGTGYFTGLTSSYVSDKLKDHLIRRGI